MNGCTASDTRRRWLKVAAAPAPARPRAPGKPPPTPGVRPGKLLPVNRTRSVAVATAGLAAVVMTAPTPAGACEHYQCAARATPSLAERRYLHSRASRLRA